MIILFFLKFNTNL